MGRCHPSKGTSMTKDEALKLALGYVERNCPALVFGEIKEALAQPEQEPACPECTAAVLYECVACSSNNYPPKPEQEPDLTIVYQSGYYDGKKDALAKREWNFCERCGKRTADLTTIHTCTPPQENT